MTQTCLSRKQRLLVAGTLFGMFFGAGNLIFPVHLGQLDLFRTPVFPGNDWIYSDCRRHSDLGVAAIGNTHSEDFRICPPHRTQI